VLREVKDVRQERGPGRRRWFQSDGFELVVWLSRSGDVTGFQICYNLGGTERALTWRPRSGFVHSHVDGGDDSPLKNMTPVLQPDGVVPWPELIARFEERSGLLEPALREFVRERLATGANRKR
jgi:hypothetical protein